jgi:hypothetical protein
VHSLLRTLEHHGVPDTAAKVVIVVALFVAASLVARLAQLAARTFANRTSEIPADSPLIALAQRETAVSLIQTSVGITAYLIAFTLSLVVVTGARGLGAVAGASFAAIAIGFAAQRFLIDLIAGFVMYTEGWYTVGSTIVVEPWKLEGIVEEFSLRATKLRDVSGEVLRVHNSQILAVRVLPNGGHRIEIELFVHDGEAGAQLVEHVAQLLPQGPTAFTQTPQVRHVQELDGDLFRVTADAAVAAGRSWLAEDLLPSLLKERAQEGLIVHGPVILPVDDSAATRFARAQRLREIKRQRVQRGA